MNSFLAAIEDADLARRVQERFIWLFGSEAYHRREELHRAFDDGSIVSHHGMDCVVASWKVEYGPNPKATPRWEFELMEVTVPKPAWTSPLV